MSITIKKPGILSTVQDLGRTGARCYGVNPGGVMDTAAARIVNTILGNDETDSVVELHFPAVEMQFDADTPFAIGGADFGATLDGVALRNWSTAFAKPGCTLTFTRKQFGSRAYVAVPGGFEADRWRDSASTNLSVGIGGFAGRAVRAGDHLEVRDQREFCPFSVGASLLPRYGRSSTVRFLPGSEFEFLNGASEPIFINDAFTLTNDCNRMGYRLAGPPLHLLHSHEMVSAAVTFGTVQLLPDGQLIVLMADHQTSGGYPRIANVISSDLPILAQCGPGERVRFEMVSIEEAERIALRFETELNFLKVGCKLQRRC